MPSKPRSTKADADARRLRVFDAWSKGALNHEQAVREGIHVTQIQRDLDAVFANLSPGTEEAKGEAVRRMLAQIEWQMAELRAAWERSKKPKDRKRARRTEGLGSDGHGERRDAEIVTEGRDGNPRFMEAIKSLRELEAKLRGLLKEQLELSGTDGAPIAVRVIEFAGPPDDIATAASTIAPTP